MTTPKDPAKQPKRQAKPAKKAARKAANVGRPTKYTPQRVRTIYAAIADGMPLKFAAAVAGISKATLFEWQSQFPDFSDRIKEAEAKGIQARLRLINKAGKRDYKAAQWWLEHVHPEHFARNRVEVSGINGAPIVQTVEVKSDIDFSKLTTDEIKKLRESEIIKGKARAA